MGIGIAIGCVAAIVVLMVAMLAMGACTCQACSSCCHQMSDLAEKSRQMEQREAARIHPMGETVHVDSLAVTVTDAQRQESTVVVTLQIENTSLVEEDLEPTQFIIEDSNGKRHAVDTQKARLTMDGVQPGQKMGPEETATTRAVFTVDERSTGLILEFKTPEPLSHRRRFSLGL